ncbi:MAG: hypothetical protein RR483_01545 [Clostridia bacterium]
MKKVQKFLKIIFAITVVFVVSISASMFASAISNTYTAKNTNKTTYDQYQLFAEYDYGTWLPNDDAYIQTQSKDSGAVSRYAYCEAYNGSYKKTAMGNDLNKFSAYVEIPGVDKFTSAKSNANRVKSGGLYDELILKITN